MSDSANPSLRKRTGNGRHAELVTGRRIALIVAAGAAALGFVLLVASALM
jgi:hypothetical protein